MPILQWATVLLCAVQGGYMVLDGGRALLVGSYITPGSGEHAGQLGPWARLVSLVGVEPESPGMKLVFVVLGLVWIGVGTGLAAGYHWAWAAGLVTSVVTLWYLVPGTVIALLVLVLLLTPQVRHALGRG